MWQVRLTCSLAHAVQAVTPCLAFVGTFPYVMDSFGESPHDPLVLSPTMPVGNAAVREHMLATLKAS